MDLQSLSISHNMAAFYDQGSCISLNFLTIFIDYSSYVIMPMEGGYFATNSHDKYKRDEYAYIDAGVTEEFLFIETTNLFKEKFWQFFGLFKRVAETTGIDYEEESQQEWGRISAQNWSELRIWM